MGAAVGIAMLVAVIGAWWAYQSWLTRGIQERVIETAISPEQIKSIFRTKVATLGWKVVDDDLPMVAQSPLLAGRRQQIALDIAPLPDGRHRCRIAPSRVWTKGFARVPYKAHTLRMRLNAFERAVGAARGSRSSGSLLPAAKSSAGRTEAPAPQPRVSPQPTPPQPSTPPQQPSVTDADGRRRVPPEPAAVEQMDSPPQPSPSAGSGWAWPGTRSGPEPEPGAAASGRVEAWMVGEHDGHTMTAAQLAEMRSRSDAVGGAVAATPDRAPAVPLIEPSDDGTAPTSWRVTFDYGDEFIVERPTLIGRDPIRQPDDPPFETGRITDPSMTVSKTHVALVPRRDELWVIDRGSSNGSSLSSPSLGQRTLRPGVAACWSIDEVLRVGDRTAKVTRIA